MKCKTARCSGKALGVAPLLPSLAIVGSLRNQSRSVLSSARDEKNTGLASAPCRLASLKEMPAFQRTISYGVLKTTIHCWQLIPRLNLAIVSRRARGAIAWILRLTQAKETLSWGPARSESSPHVSWFKVVLIEGNFRGPSTLFSAFSTTSASWLNREARLEMPANRMMTRCGSQPAGKLQNFC